VARRCCRAPSTRSSELMASVYSLAKVDLLLALAVVWLGRHDGRYVIGVVLWVCWRFAVDKKRGGGVCRRRWVSARCGYATLMWMDGVVL